MDLTVLSRSFIQVSRQSNHAMSLFGAQGSSAEPSIISKIVLDVFIVRFNYFAKLAKSPAIYPISWLIPMVC